MGIATIVLIVGLLALIFHSVIICLMPILVVALVSSIATGPIAWANDIFDLKADSSIQQISRRALRRRHRLHPVLPLPSSRAAPPGRGRRASVVHGLDRAGEAIASAGGAVIVAFLALILSSLSIFRAIGRPWRSRSPSPCSPHSPWCRPWSPSWAGALLAVEEVAAGARGSQFERLGDPLGRLPGRFAAVTGLVLAVTRRGRVGSTPASTSTRACPRTRSRPRHW